MKILVVGDPHGKLGKIKNLDLKKFDLVIITGDLGKVDLGRKFFFENIKREKQGLPKKEKSEKFKQEMQKEVDDSTLAFLRFFSKSNVPTYFLEGNVPFDKDKIKEIKNVHLVQNHFRKIQGLRFAFLENFIEMHWFKEFNVKDEDRMKIGMEDTAKAKKIVKWFSKYKMDVLVCHQPPYGILDKFDNPMGMKHWQGKHAGSKIILEYIKKHKPKYVLCGHIHEAKGVEKLGPTTIINAGCCGDYKIIEIL